MDILEFLARDGKSPDQEPLADASSGSTAFAEFQDRYLKSHGNGTVKKHAFETIKLHISHFATTRGERFSAIGLTFADLQRHVDPAQERAARQVHAVAE
jgi:hypothetical protein